MQRACNARGLTCTLADLATYRAGSSSAKLLLAILPSSVAMGRMRPSAEAELRSWQASGRLLFDPASIQVAPSFRKPPDVTVLLANDGSYAFVVGLNPSLVQRRMAAFSVQLAHRVVRVSSFTLPGRGTRVFPVGIRVAAVSSAPAPPPGTPPPFADPGGTTLANAALRVVFAPFAGARVAELGDGSGNAATSIGLLRDAVDPPPSPSARDYIAQYTHPLPAGTFNRPYACTNAGALGVQRTTCSYDAPDLPEGGALFTRTLTLGNGSNQLIVDEEFAPHDARSSARLESISGFSFDTGDTVIRSADAVGIRHAGEFATLRWLSGEVARVELRTTRGAQLVTLVFATRKVRLYLSVVGWANAAEARRLLDANQP